MKEPVKETTSNLYLAIRRDFNRMSRPDKEFGVQKFTDEYIFAKLAKKYFRAPSTIENIVYGRV